MATTSSNRQYVLAAEASVDFADLSAGATSANLIQLPEDAMVTGGRFVIDTDWDDDGTGVYDVDVGDAGSVNRYLDAASVDADAGTAKPLVPTGFVHTAPTWVKVTLNLASGSGTVDQGAGRLQIEYVIAGRSNENQG